MFYLPNIYSLSDESIRNQSSIECLDNFYLGNNKQWADTGIIYITPFQVIQTFIRGPGLCHDTIVQKIETEMLKNHGASRIFMKLLRLRNPDQKNDDLFYWDVDVHLGISLLQISEISREMYEVGSRLQEYVFSMLKPEVIEKNQNNLILLDDIISSHSISITDSIQTDLQEPFFGTTLESYNSKLLHKTRENISLTQTDETTER